MTSIEQKEGDELNTKGTCVLRPWRSLMYGFVGGFLGAYFGCSALMFDASALSVEWRYAVSQAFALAIYEAAWVVPVVIGAVEGAVWIGGALWREYRKEGR